MIWLLLLGATITGLLRARQDLNAARLAIASTALLIDLALCHALGPETDTAAVDRFGRAFGAPLGQVASFLPLAHLALPVLVSYALSHLGRGGVWLGLVLVIGAVGVSAWSGASWIDLAGGIALGKLVGWATFEQDGFAARRARILAAFR